MSTKNIKTGWLNDNNGDKLAPKTLFSQVQNKDGKTLDTALKNIIFFNSENNEDVEVSGGSGANIDVTAEVGQTIIVKEVDINGKPTKWEAADYQPRTHWVEMEEILPESEVTYDAENDMFFITTDMTFAAGKTYSINYCGTTYECVSVEIDGIAGVGNVPLVMGTGDNGIPFIMFTDEGTLHIQPTAAFGDTMTVAIALNNVIPIPAQYLTNGLPYYVEVTADYNSGQGDAISNYSCSETTENLGMIYNSGRLIILRLTLKDTNPDNLAQCWCYQLSGIAGSSPYLFVFSLIQLGNAEFLYLLPQEDGTYSVSDSISD